MELYLRLMSSAGECTEAVKHVLRNSKYTVRSVSSVEGGGWVVKVSQSSECLVNRLRTVFPLASVCLYEDLAGGSAIAQVLFPVEREQRMHATLLASAMPLPRRLLILSNVLFAMFVFVFVAHVAAGTQHLM
jgi:hypothetical protein